MPTSWPRDTPPWRLWVVPAGVAFGFIGGELGIIVVDGIGSASGASVSHPTPAMAILGSIVFDLCFLAAAIGLAAATGAIRPADFGFRRVSWRTAIAATLLSAVAYYIATAVYATVFSIHATDKLPKEFGVSGSSAAVIGTAVFVCVIAPLTEETFFRGFVFGGLRRMQVRAGGRELGPWIAAFITAILFGLAHFDSAQPEFLIPLGFLGFLLCLVRWRTGSLYPCMALHSANNSLALGVQLHWSAAATFALVVGAWALVAAVAWPLGARAPALA